MLNFYQVGREPADDALRIKALYENRGIDDAIIDEFGTTVDAYKTLSITDIEERIRQKYVGTTEALGFLAVHDEEDIGRSIAGLKSFTVLGEQTRRGVNVSSWILEQYRGLGFSIEFGMYAINQAIKRTRDLSFLEWYGAPIWSSIHQLNAPSLAAANHNGFLPLGIDANKTDRIIFGYSAS